MLHMLAGLSYISLVVYLICRHFYRTFCNFFLTLSIAVPFIRNTLTPTRTGGHMVRCDRPVLGILRNTKRVVQNLQAQPQSLDLRGEVHSNPARALRLLDP